MPKSHRPYPPDLRQRIVELVRKGSGQVPRRSVSTLTATRAPILSCTFLMNPLH